MPRHGRKTPLVFARSLPCCVKSSVTGVNLLRDTFWLPWQNTHLRSLRCYLGSMRIRRTKTYNMAAVFKLRSIQDQKIRTTRSAEPIYSTSCHPIESRACCRPTHPSRPDRQDRARCRDQSPEYFFQGYETRHPGNQGVTCGGRRSPQLLALWRSRLEAPSLRLSASSNSWWLVDMSEACTP